MPVERSDAQVSLYGYVPADRGANNPGSATDAGQSSAYAVHLSNADTSWNHKAHDLSIFVAPDAESIGLLATGNLGDGAPGEAGRIELEWEHTNVPTFVWPRPGDRVWVMGRHVFDCGHGADTQPVSYRTEIHPPRALAVMRRVEPEARPEAAGDLVPVRRVDIWVNGDGGMFAGVHRIDDRNLDFYVPLPPRPSPDAQPILDQTYDAGPSAGGRVTASLVAEPAQSPNRVHVTLPLRGSGATKLAMTLHLGWNRPAVAAVRRFQVTFDTLHVDDRIDLDAQGHWKVWTQVNGRWAPVPHVDSVVDGQTVNVGHTVAVNLYDGDPLEIFAGGFAAGCMDEHFGEAAVLYGDGITIRNFGLSNCLFGDRQTASGNNMGIVLRTYTTGDGPAGPACAGDYGTAAPHDDPTNRVWLQGPIDTGIGPRRPLPIATTAFHLRYRIAELPAGVASHLTVRGSATATAGSPTDTAASPLDKITIRGSGFHAGETVKVELRGAGRVVEIGNLPVTCGQGFSTVALAPRVPAGVYTLVGTDRSGAQASTLLEIVPAIHAEQAGHVGFGFGAGETVRFEHMVIADRLVGGRSSLPPAGKHGAVVIGSAAWRAARGPIKLQPSGRLDWIAAASVTAVAGQDGSVAATLPPDQLPAGWALPPSSYPLFSIFGHRATQYVVATGLTTTLAATCCSDAGDRSTSDFWHKYTLDPNRMIGPIDPVSLVSFLDHGERDPEEPEFQSVLTVAAVQRYLREQATSGTAGPLSKAILAALDRDLVALAEAAGKGDQATAARTIAAFVGRLPAVGSAAAKQTAMLRQWAQHATDRIAAGALPR